jgi:hypothetical protein
MYSNFPDFIELQNSLLIYTKGWPEECFLSGRVAYLNLPQKYFERIKHFDYISNVYPLFISICWQVFKLYTDRL